MSEGQAHYLRNVMRKAAGDTLRVFNGQDGEWLATLEELNKKNAFIKLNHQLLEQKQGADIWVLCSPVKKEAFDLMVEKACELGVTKFIPVICEHTIVHKINQQRLQSVAIEAAEQSERLDVMTVEPLIALKDFLNTDSYNRNIIFCIERSGAATFAEIAQKLSGKPLAILIGPEGGFSTQEIDFINKSKNVYSISLGPRILKSETALIAAVCSLSASILWPTPKA